MIPNDFRCYSYLNVGTRELLQDRFAGNMLSQEMGNSSRAAKNKGRVIARGEGNTYMSWYPTQARLSSMHSATG
jgi:hypothetical protein